MQPTFQLDNRPLIEPELLFVPELPLDLPASSEEPEFEKVILKTRVPFERKRLDLSIYTFDETPIEQSFEETLLDASSSFYNFKYLSEDIGCVSLQVEDAFPHDAADDEMICCMKSSNMTNQKEHRPKLKKTKNKVDRLNEKLIKRLSTSKFSLKRTH